MFENIEYDNFPFIVSSGEDFEYEIRSIKSEILPKIKLKFNNIKWFSVNFFDIIYENYKTFNNKSCDLNDFVSLNLDSIHENGSICICLLGEKFHSDPKSNRNSDPSYYTEQLKESVNNAVKSGYSWIEEINQDTDSSMLEILCLHAGLMAGVKYPLFYFRVSGGPISVNEDLSQVNNNDTETKNDRMERLKQKLIRNGLPIKFYGSALEFHAAVEADLDKIFAKFPDKTDDQDSLLIDQKCFEHNHMKTFIFNDNIMSVFQKLDRIYNSLKNWKEVETSTTNANRIDELIKDFNRKEYSDRLSLTYQKIRISTTQSESHKNRILVMTGLRGSGKSSILINWFMSKKLNDKMININHYCGASFVSSDLRMMLRTIIKKIRLACGYSLEQDNYETFPLDVEIIALTQQLYGAMLLARKNGYTLLLIIDGLDLIGDRCAISSKQIKFIEWIPEFIPDNVRIIISSATSDSSLIKLKEKRIDLECFDLLPETVDEQQLLIESGVSGFQTWITGFHQTFPEDLLQNIQEWSLIRIPLAQKILARVYHTIGTTTNWIKFIEKVSESQTLVELVRRVLKLNIHFLNWEILINSEKLIKKKNLKNPDEKVEVESAVQGWIPDFLSLLALSRTGLDMDTILSSLELLGYVKDFQVLESDIWKLFHFTREIILQFHDNKFSFTHSICKEIVEHTFLAIASCSAMEARTQECHDSMYIDKRYKLHILLAYVLRHQKNKNEYNFLECIYHLDRASDYETLEKLMFTPCVLLSIFNLNFENISTWNGHFNITHWFQYYYNLLNQKGRDMELAVETLLKNYYDMELENEHYVVYDSETTDVDVEISHKRSSSRMNYSKSEFSKRLSIKIDENEEKESWSLLSHEEKCRFLLLLGQVSFLMDHKKLARQIYNQIYNISQDKILICQVLWFDIQLDSSFHEIQSDKEYINSMLIKLLDLTRSLLDDKLLDGTDEEKLKYIRCMALVLKCSNTGESLKKWYFPAEHLELTLCASSIQSIVLNSIIQEFDHNSIGQSDDIEVIQDKISLLSNIIVNFETWTGPINDNLAKLFVKLAMLFKHGNTQSRCKAEACCRRALWIWKHLSPKEEVCYNYDENECREILFNLLIQDPSNSSTAEAKTQIYTSFDNRMKFLGCYHPLTVHLVPALKYVNTLSIQSVDSFNIANKVSNSQSRGSSTLTRNLSSYRTNTSITNSSKDKQLRESSSQIQSRNLNNSSLQFINRYSNNFDCFSEDIDWNMIANNGISSRMSRNSDSRLSNSINRKQRSTSSYLNSTPIRCHSTSIGSDQPNNIYLCSNSSLRHLTYSNIRFDKIFLSKKDKQVTFDSMHTSLKEKLSNAEMSKILQKKILNMKSASYSPITLKKRSISANFSRPYYTIIDETI